MSKFLSTLLIQFSQGINKSLECIQLIVLAKILATEVFPVPCGPLNK
ncbi:Uncharacterised protein [Chlamydia abortus]|nr:Uncharacterised protein [Chlamydia abortus]